MQTLFQDLRYALRQLRHSPAFTFTAVITLALGIGANTAIFTLVHAVLLQSLPVANPGQLYKLGDRYNCCVMGSLQDQDWAMFSYRFYVQARDHTPAFEELAAAQTNRHGLSVRVAGENSPADLFRGELVSGNYFSTFGLRPAAGRLLSSTDDSAAAAPVAVMSYRTWQRRYAADESLIGKALIVNGNPMTLIGVAPPGFFGERLESDPPDFWLPLSYEPTLDGQGGLLNQPLAFLYVLGRLNPGAQPAQVQAQLTAELRSYLATPGNVYSSLGDISKRIPKQEIHLAPGGSGIQQMKYTYEKGLYLLMAASTVLLIIACANLANLLLARSTGLRSRIALQLAMGASRRRIMAAQLTESVLLACLGGAAGLLLAFYGTKAMLLIAFRGADFVPISASPSIPVLGFTFVVALLTGIAFGAGPAWLASRSDPAEALRGTNRATRDRSALPQKSLIVLQAGLSLALLCIAGLLTQSLRNLQNQDYGFQRQGRLVIRIDPQAAGYTPERLMPLYRKIEDRFSSLPGVSSESLSIYAPQQHDSWGESVYFPGKPKQDDNSSWWDRVSAHYFESIGTPIVQGRGFNEQDTATSQKFAVVNEAFVRRFLLNEDPIGQHFGMDFQANANDFTIVGVAKDAKYRNAEEPATPMFFVPLEQPITYQNPDMRRLVAQSLYMHSIQLHVAADPDAMIPAVRRAFADIDPNLALLSIRSYADQVKIMNSDKALISRLSGVFGLLALLLASVGLYGVTAYRVARRTSEVGVRMALGATRTDILALVLQGAFAQVGLGLLIGIPLAIGAGKLLAHQLYGVSFFDPVIMAVAVGVLAFCALLASILPAGQAASIEPMVALRAE